MQYGNCNRSIAERDWERDPHCPTCFGGLGLFPKEVIDQSEEKRKVIQGQDEFVFGSDFKLFSSARCVNILSPRY